MVARGTVRDRPVKYICLAVVCRSSIDVTPKDRYLSTSSCKKSKFRSEGRIEVDSVLGVFVRHIFDQVPITHNREQQTPGV